MRLRIIAAPADGGLYLEFTEGAMYFDCFVTEADATAIGNTLLEHFKSKEAKA